MVEITRANRDVLVASNLFKPNSQLVDRIKHKQLREKVAVAGSWQLWKYHIIAPRCFGN
jgi:hypothetical protein